MNPIKTFENAAFKALRREAPAEQIALSLRSVGRAIQTYLDRIDKSKIEKMNVWHRDRALRALEYLKLLRRDIVRIAEECVADSDVAPPTRGRTPASAGH